MCLCISNMSPAEGCRSPHVNMEHFFYKCTSSKQVCFSLRSVCSHWSTSASRSISWWWHHIAVPPWTGRWCCCHYIWMDKTWPDPQICPCVAFWWEPAGPAASFLQRENITLWGNTEVRRHFTETVQRQTLWWGKVQMLHSRMEQGIICGAHCW